MATTREGLDIRGMVVSEITDFVQSLAASRDDIVQIARSVQTYVREPNQDTHTNFTDTLQT